ncbi:MAG: M20 family metallopeptidase [Candidatus Thorarchaeota archaeon]
MSKKYTNWIEENRQRLIDISNKIWEFAEVGFEEIKSSNLLAETLEKAGFSVKRNVAGIPTAFYASFGDDKPVIAILGEYDALPGLSQIKEPIRKPLKEGAPGHGCGHNLLGTGSLGAVLAVKEAILSGDANGTIRYYGCPAEEKFNSKGYMINAGAFKDVDITLSWHPAFMNAINDVSLLALNSVKFKFLGRTAHAAFDPENGRSALDAVELMNIGVNFLREHIIPDARIHYVITNGGDTPNVVPDEAEVYYFIRAPKRSSVEELYKRVINIAEGAAMMTETKMVTNFLGGMCDPIRNDVIENVLLSKMRLIGAPRYNKEEREFAEKLKKTLPPGSMEAFSRAIPSNLRDMAKQILDQPLNRIILPGIGKEKVMPGSSDVSDVSRVTPLGEISTTCQIMGSPQHSWQIVCTSGMSIGHKGMLMAAKILALSAIEFMNNPDLVNKAKREFEEKTKNNPYISPFPKGFKPPFINQ